MGTTLTETEVIDCVNRSLTGYFTYYNEYKKILRKYRPKYIVETTHYETAKLSLNVAAHELGIKVFELQHGVMNIQYNIPEKINLFLMKCLHLENIGTRQRVILGKWWR